MAIYNLDELSGSIIDLKYHESIFDISPEVTVTFTAENGLTEADTIQIMGTEFSPFSFKRLPNMSNEMYIWYGRPKHLLTIIDKDYDSASSLASVVDLQLTSDSTDVTFEYSFLNLKLSTLLYRLRHNYYQQHQNPLDFLFLFVDGNGLTCIPLQSMTTVPPQPFNLNNGNQLIYDYVDDSLLNNYKSSDFPTYQKYGSLVQQLFTSKIEVKSNFYAKLGLNQTFSFSGSPDPVYKTAIFQSYDYQNKTNPWTIIYGVPNLNPVILTNSNVTGDSSNLTW